MKYLNEKADKLKIKGSSFEMALMFLTLFFVVLFLAVVRSNSLFLPTQNMIFKILLILGLLILSFRFLKMSFRPIAILDNDGIKACYKWKNKWKNFSWDQAESLNTLKIPFGFFSSVAFKSDQFILKIYSDSSQYFEFLSFASKKIKKERIDAKTLDVLSDKKLKDIIIRSKRVKRTYLIGIWFLILGLILLHYSSFLFEKFF